MSNIFIHFNELPKNIQNLMNAIPREELILNHLNEHSIGIWMYIFRRNNLPEEEINAAMMPFTFGINNEDK